MPTRFLVPLLILLLGITGCSTVGNTVSRGANTVGNTVGNTVESGATNVSRSTRSLWNSIFGGGSSSRSRSSSSGSTRSSSSSKPKPPPPTLENRPRQYIGQ